MPFNKKEEEEKKNNKRKNKQTKQTTTPNKQKTKKQKQKNKKTTNKPLKANKFFLAQSAEVYNTRIASLPRSNTLSPTSVLIMTLNDLMERLQFWIFEKWGKLLHCHYSQTNSDSEW